MKKSKSKTPAQQSKLAMIAVETAEAHKDLATTELHFRLNLHTARVEALEQEERDLSASLRETRKLLAEGRAAQSAIKTLIAARK